MENLMIDLETMGDISYSAIISLAAVEFDIETGQTGKEFYKKIDLQSCLDEGLVVTAKTIEWWMEKSDEERKEFLSGPKMHLVLALSEFANFCKDRNYSLWGNGSRFDCGILADAYRKCGLLVPWNTFKEMDVRTLVRLHPQIKHSEKFVGVRHNPIADCKHQIKYCHKTWQKLNTK